jgi:hypothetical protein
MTVHIKRDLTEEQKREYEKRTAEMQRVAELIAALPISEEWVNRFTKMAFYRGWRKLTDHKQKRLIHIAEVNSPSVATIVDQRHTKISTEMIEKIATVVTDEKDRAKICNYLLEKSWKDAKRDVALIIAGYEEV